jgi:hypothetical protein
MLVSAELPSTSTWTEIRETGLSFDELRMNGTFAMGPIRRSSPDVGVLAFSGCTDECSILDPI